LFGRKISKIFLQSLLLKNTESELSKIELADLDNKFSDDVAFINHDSVSSLRVSDQNGSTLAYLVNAEWVADNNAGLFSWLISPQGEVIAVQPIKSSFNTIIGKNIKASSECSTFAELAASELFQISGIGKQLRN